MLNAMLQRGTLMSVIVLIIAVLGSILGGIATPTEGRARRGASSSTSPSVSTVSAAAAKP